LAELPFFTGEEGRGHLLALLFFLSASVVTIWGTWQGALPASDEAILAQTAREVLTTPGVRTLHFDGNPVYDTPPLAPWLMSFFFLVFGVNVFAARFAFVLLSIGTLYSVYLAGRMATQDWEEAAEEPCGIPSGSVPHRAHWGSLPTAVGFLSAIVLASSPLFGRFSPHITLGLPFAFFAALALLGWLQLPARRFGNVLWGAGVAGSFLSAGGSAFLLVIGCILASLVERSHRRLWRSPAFIVATLAGVGIGMLWLIPVTAASGRGFFTNPLWSPIAGIIRPPAGAAALVWDSLKSTWFVSLPWAIPATVAAGRIIFSSARRRRAGLVSDIDDALLIFAVVIFLPLSISGTGPVSRFLVVMPFIAVLSTREVVRWMRRAGKRLTKRVWTANHVMTALFCLLMLLVVATPLRLRRASSDTMKNVARMAERLTSEGTRIGNYRQPYHEQCAQMLFYGNRSLAKPFEDPGDVAAALRNDPRAIFLSSARDVEALRGSGEFPFDIRVLFGADDLVLFGAREPAPGDAQ
jgi:4-amino-4-deoxy-L-arabinose transferase-like glycosyltransferase